MRLFLTGATGYVATAIAAELKGAGHTVLGLARTDEGAGALAARGVEPHRGELADHASARRWRRCWPRSKGRASRSSPPPGSRC